ncbi:PilN domain-containing protein [Ruegeria sp. SCPT10]|uniref:PilN domain-containing protein n=1 Tax=Ruegeria sp. SCP10 TaxID=3141377 RepID=UPI003334CBB5
MDVYLPPELFFERRLVLPVTACDKLQEVALLDLQSRTPFELADIYWRLGRPAKKNSVIEVSQWIVRREDVQSWKHNLERNGYRVCKLFVDIDSAPLPVVDFSDEILPGRQTFRKLNIALACTALLSLFSAWLYPGWSARIDTRVLQLELDTLRSQALLERHKVEEIRQTEAQKTTLVDAVMLRPLLVDTLRELTISLEDDVWVSSMAFNTSRVVITGEAGNSAAEAVLSLGERSGFGNPRISGPVSRTARGSEQFEITLDLGAPG